jgi:DNA-binding protein H-NS
MALVNLEAFPTDELWAIHEQVSYLLTRKLQAEKWLIEARLIELRRRADPHPKFRNPEAPFQIWSGRGRQPMWIRRLLAAGKTMEELRLF